MLGLVPISQNYTILADPLITPTHPVATLNKKLPQEQSGFAPDGEPQP